METFKYTAQNETGQTISGVVEAFDKIEATAKIRNTYGTVISMQETQDLSGVQAMLSADIGGAKLNSKAFTLMCNQFSTILQAGIPVARAVELVADKTTDKTIKKTLLAVADDVEAGRTISSSFEEHGKKWLPPTFVETIRAGEESGNLANSFESIYRHFDKQTKMTDKVRGAMMYPIFVLFIAITVVIVLMVKVVPTFTSIFTDIGGQMPFMTKLLISMSEFVRDTFVYFLLIVAALLVAYSLFKTTEKGKMILSKIQLALPVFGNITQLNAASLFANTMATMISSGLPMTKAVAITASVMPNYLYQTKIAGMVDRIEEGRTVVDSMRETGIMPDILTDMVGVGEETGEMKTTLDTVALYYDSELELAINRAVGMLEPALLCFIAVIAGFIVIAIYTSMFEMYNAM